MPRRNVLFTYTVAVAVSLSFAFNLDLSNTDVYAGAKDAFFGYKVLQTNKGVIITAPLQHNGSGSVCTPASPNSTEPCFSPKEISIKNSIIPIKHLGLSLAKDPVHSQFTVSSPSLVHECYENSYLNSVLYTVSHDLKDISSMPVAFQECTKKTVNLVFLFDGSRSMTAAEFEQNKVFIKEIMTNLSGSSIKFAAVQFSTTYKTVFDFNDYTAGKSDRLLMAEPHMNGLTNTYRALTFVLENILENPKAGASQDATKVLVLITDGDPSDRDRNNITGSYDKMNIIRFVIGVKAADLSKFKTIVSEESSAFKIEDYAGLPKILDNFQTRIFKIEGSTHKRAGDLKNEMSQSGFSTVFHKDALILGAVGSNSWSGTLMEYKNGKITQIEDPLMEMDSYLGYSTAVGEKNNVTFYIAGAPRSNYKGQVVFFMNDGKNWSPMRRIDGEQIGSYFGAELCSLDVNSDGDTDFLLVGAPLFYQPQHDIEGKLYVYTLAAEVEVISVQNVSAASMSRFGTTISPLADLNGDGLRDVAVGAPLEDESRGAVYIYLGDKQSGIRSTFSQKILGEKVEPGLRYFGQAIDGETDLGMDGLPDIVVGSQGKAIVLRSRPVVDVSARLTFQPHEISTENIDCSVGTDINLPMVTLTACFQMREMTSSKTGLVHGPNISCTFNVDPKRQTNRGFFGNSNRKARTMTTYQLLSAQKDTCLNFSIYMPKCVRDTRSSVKIELHFSQENSEDAAAVLNVDSNRLAVIEVPFQKVCRQNDTCIAELEVNFNFTTATLLVAEESYFNINITLSNHGDDSYNTNLSMHYPQSLSFSQMTLIRATRSALHRCDDLEGVLDKTTCGVSLPVYRSKSVATFLASFYIQPQQNWNDSVTITVHGTSENSNSNGTQTKVIPVQFQIKMAISVREDTVTYVNLTTEYPEPKKIAIKYVIDNLGFKEFPVNVSLTIPTQLEHSFEMINYGVTVAQNKTQCKKEAKVDSEFCTQEKSCTSITCDTFVLEKESTTEIELSGDMHFKDLKDLAENVEFFKRFTGDSGTVQFKSSMHVYYDKQKYVLDSRKQGDLSVNSEVSKWHEIRVEFIILPHELTIMATGAGLGFLLLVILTIIMLKLGCFKRRKFENKEETAAQADPPESDCKQPKETESKSEEVTALLDDDEANGNNMATDLKLELD